MRLSRFPGNTVGAQYRYRQGASLRSTSECPLPTSAHLVRTWGAYSAYNSSIFNKTLLATVNTRFAGSSAIKPATGTELGEGKRAFGGEKLRNDLRHE